MTLPLFPLLLFTSISVSKCRGSSRSLLSGKIQLFFRIPGQDADLLAVEVPSNATIQDIIDRAGLPEHSTLTFQGHEQNSDGALSDLGIVPESTLSVARRKDIEMLFHLFDDPADTEKVFSFKTYSEFKAAVPPRVNKNTYFQGTIIHETGLNSLTVLFTDKGQGEFVAEINIIGIPVQSLNWNTLSHFHAMRKLWISDSEIDGDVQFEKLPRNLEWLLLGSNHLSGYVSFETLPRGLKALRLDGNSFNQTLDAQAVRHLPPTMEILCLDGDVECDQFRGSIKRSDLPTTIKDIWHGPSLTLD